MGKSYASPNAGASSERGRLIGHNLPECCDFKVFLKQCLFYSSHCVILSAIGVHGAMVKNRKTFRLATGNFSCVQCNFRINGNPVTSAQSIGLIPMNRGTCVKCSRCFHSLLLHCFSVALQLFFVGWFPCGFQVSFVVGSERTQVLFVSVPALQGQTFIQNIICDHMSMI